MFEPIRGGTRGGQAEFKWSDVSADKDRENYLGHSINAPTGRWQKNKDVHWYNRDLKQGDAERAEEIRKIKEAEADALAVALGFEPASKTPGAPATAAGSPSGSPKPAEDPNAAVLEKAERRRKKAERKEEKRAKKEQRRLEREPRHSRLHSRSRSPPHRRTPPPRDDRDRRERDALQRRELDRQDRDRVPDRRPRDAPDRRDRSPARRSRSPARPSIDYEATDRERERERDRRRWDDNARREQPGDAQRGRR
ncbi:kinase phosphorylation protein-domain-containing protein [Mycena belliarum]|uniref:Kinase phosphorylation protein-domain-containing protein n=1 Tax=Mycena belliarum TaxID=1033014 RepID=A0AAD6U0T1_9AGAR|nr:kinase phosphorylation protein-domain-containing protein [Mycena belliae]